MTYCDGEHARFRLHPDGCKRCTGRGRRHQRPRILARSPGAGDCRVDSRSGGGTDREHLPANGLSAESPITSTTPSALRCLDAAAALRRRPGEGLVAAKVRHLGGRPALPSPDF